MKILSIIGTRPQYIKIKPIYDSFKKYKIEHLIIDSGQHYSNNVSKSIIDDLKINIDYTFSLENLDEMDFMTNFMKLLKEKIVKEKPDLILVFGDTNTTFCASVVAYKLGIKLAHIESGERSESLIPEEVNRIYCDLVSNIHFCSSLKNTSNVTNPVLTGDLEYELLNKYNPDISYSDYVVLTLHRQENMRKDKLASVFSFLKKLNVEVIFPIHHRTKKFIEDNEVKLPSFIRIREPATYTEMVTYLANCRSIVTDSGGIHKSSPFFGKKSIVFRDGNEWSETYERGYSKKFADNEETLAWLSDSQLERDKHFYLQSKMPSRIIIETLHEHILL